MSCPALVFPDDGSENINANKAILDYISKTLFESGITNVP
jgi:hypothetical protein